MDIKSSSFDMKNRELEVTYMDDSVYRYSNIDVEEYNELAKFNLTQEAFDQFIINYEGIKIS